MSAKPTVRKYPQRQMSNRNYLMARIAICKNWAIAEQAFFNDEAHRDILQRYGAIQVNGKFSATTLTTTQARAVIAHYEAMGAPKHKRKMADGTPPQVVTILHLWGRLGDNGKVYANRHTLMQWLHKHVGQCHNIEDLTTKQRSQAIEQLKAWDAR